MNNTTNLIPFPSGPSQHQRIGVKVAAQAKMQFLRSVAMNSDTEYAQSFGISQGDLIFLSGKQPAEGDLVLVELPSGAHELDTFNDSLQNPGLGVIAGVLKYFLDRVIDGGAQ